MKATNDEASLWQQRIDAWRESGLKQSVWCRQNDEVVPNNQTT